MPSKKLAIKLLSIALTAALLVFAYKYISGIVRSADFSNLSVNWLLVILSALTFTIFYSMLSLHWTWACRLTDKNTPDNQLLAFFASQPYKYLPTSLFTFSFRAVYAKKLGLGLKKSSIAQFFENASMLASNLMIFTVAYLADRDIVYSIVAMILVVVGVLFFSKIRRITVVVKKKRLELDTIRISKMFVLASFGWLVAGFSFVSLNFALGLDINLMKLIAANTIAFSLSILAFFAPGGLGVREVVYDMFLVSASAIIFWRILTFILDFLLGATAIYAIKRQREQSN